jgi:hypothetical protein
MRLIFVYNADSGRLNTLFDIGHKILSPGTYACSLCKLSYGMLSETKAWRDFRERSPVEMMFLHRDEFEREYDMHLDYPVVLKQSTAMEVLIPKEVMDSLNDVDELIGAIEETIAES